MLKGRLVEGYQFYKPDGLFFKILKLIMCFYAPSGQPILEL